MRRDEVPLTPPPAKQRPGDWYQCGAGSGADACSLVHCPSGPTRRGACPRAQTDPERACRPVPTWRHRRRRIAVTGLLIFASAMTVLIAGDWTPTVIRPGELSTPHAQILSGANAADRCAACHNNVSTQTWFSVAEVGHADAIGRDLMSQDMTDRCLNCHHEQIPEPTARTAHNLPLDTLDALTAQAKTRAGVGSAAKASRVRFRLPAAVGRDALDCALCHREHHGPDFDLSVLTDAQCQSCHANAFTSFAGSHPDFEAVPVSRPSRITFDHVSHAAEHFPKSPPAGGESGVPVEGRAFDCRDCHRQTSTDGDGITMTLPYETACAACHDETLRVQTAIGPELLTLPTLPTPVTTELARDSASKSESASWPVAATGFADGRFPPLTRLLMSLPIDAPSWRSLTDVSRVDWDDPVARQQVILAAKQLRSLTIGLARDGQAGLSRRFGDAGVNPDVADRLAASLPPQLIRDAVMDWFDETVPLASDAASQSGLSGADDLLPPDVSPGDGALIDFSGQPPAAQETDWRLSVRQRFDPAVTQHLGGWTRDDVTFSLRYRGTGHADVVLRSIIELASDLPGGHPLRVDLLADPAATSCLRCHAGAANRPAADEDPLARWRAPRKREITDAMTHFSHSPHLNIRELQDCRACHRVRPTGSGGDDANESLARVGTMLGIIHDVHADAGSTTDRSEFLPLGKSTCVGCHNAATRQDHCTQCHRYHVTPMPPLD